MDLNRQVFRAPSIPKIGRRNVSSSAIRGALKPQIKLNRSTFSFIKPTKKEIDVEKIGKLSAEKNISVEATLGETNKILVEIQKQLALDFGYRIAEEKKALAAERKRIAAQKVSDKEASIEKGQKGILGKTFDKVVAPFKSIFQKLIDFFSIILTGILLNTAFKWLSNKENRKKLKQFFDFIKEYWQELLIIFAAYKLARLVSKVFGIARNIKKVLTGLGALIRKLKGQKPPTGGGGDPCKPLLQCMGNPAFSSAFVSSSIAAFLANAQLRNYIQDVAQGSYLPGAQPALPLVPQNPLTLPTPQQPVNGPVLDPFTGKPLVPLTGKPEKIEELTPEQLKQQRRKEDIEKFREQFIPGGYSVDNVKRVQGKFTDPSVARAWGAINQYRNDPEIKALLGDLVQAGALIAIDGPFPAGDAAAVAKLGSMWHKFYRILSKKSISNLPRSIGSPAVARAKGGTIPELPEKKKCTACSLGFSQGGTVGGRGSGLVDTIPAMLAAGEEVIRTSMSMMWRPLLKDINDNGAKLWMSFQRGTLKQDLNNKINYELNVKLVGLLKELLELVSIDTKRIQKNKNKGGAGGAGGGIDRSTIGSNFPTSPITDYPLSDELKRLKMQLPVEKTYRRNEHQITPNGLIDFMIPSWMKWQSIPDSPYPHTSYDKEDFEKGVKYNPFFQDLIRFPYLESTPREDVDYKMQYAPDDYDRYSPEYNTIQAKLSRIPIQTRNLRRTKGQPKVNVINLPPETMSVGPKPGSLKLPSSGEATTVPTISPFDASNAYIAFTPDEYGMVM